MPAGSLSDSSSSNSLSLAGGGLQTTCRNQSVTWWNNADGLNPCEQYQRLRATCDAGYTVPLLAIDDEENVATDACSSVRDSCCCNSVAFTLSMLCLNCQQGYLSDGSAAINAPPASFQRFTRKCFSAPNGGLAPETKSELQDSGISISPFLLAPIPSDGSWNGTQIFSLRQRESGSAPSTPAPASTQVLRPWGPGNVIATRTQLPHRTRVLIGALLGASVVLVALLALAYALYRNRRDKREEREYAERMAQAQRRAVSQSRARRQRPYAFQSDRATVGSTDQVNIERPRVVSVQRPRSAHAAPAPPTNTIRES